KKKLQIAMLAAAGLLPATANAEVGAAHTTMMLNSGTRNAPVTNTNPPRLQRTDEEQPANEMPDVALFNDGKTGLYVVMAGEINGVRANKRIQLGVVPFHLAQAADGSVSAVTDMTGARFATNNDGNEYRNANHPMAFAAFGGNNICAEYN